MDELLQRLRKLSAVTRTSSNASEGGELQDRPPNAVAAALGRHVAQVWMEQWRTTLTLLPSASTPLSSSSSSSTTSTQSLDQKILLALTTTPGLNSAFPHEFFSTILQSYKSNNNSTPTTRDHLTVPSLLEWLPRWVLRIDEVAFESGKSVDGGVLESLWAAIRTLVTVVFSSTTTFQTSDKLVRDDEDDAVVMVLANTYRRLKVGRVCFLRHVAQAAVCPPVNNHLSTASDETIASATKRRLRYLTPIMASCVLSWSSSYSEKLLFLERLWRELRLRLQQHMLHPNERLLVVVATFLEWFTRVLLLYLWRLPFEPTPTHVVDMIQPSGKELALRWLQEIVDQGVVVVGVGGLSTNIGQVDMTSTIQLVLYQVIPLLVAHQPHQRLSLAPIVTQLTMMIQNSQQTSTSTRTAAAVVVDAGVAMRLAVTALADPITDDVVAMIQLCLSCHITTEATRRAVQTLASVYLVNTSYHEVAAQLYQQHAVVASERGAAGIKTNHATITTTPKTFHHLGLFDQDRFARDELMQFIAQADPTKWRLASAIQQSAALFVGASMLQGRRSEDEAIVVAYLKKLLTTFPHLCSTFLPIVMDLLRRGAVSDDHNGDHVLFLLEILCDTVVMDPPCAQEVWNLLVTRGDSPLLFRSTVVRLYPRLCAANRRLTRRVTESLGPWVSPKTNVELRVAVAATLSDLAKEDLLRDITDVVTWVQSFLADENPAVVHYAILTLHHLVLAQELDFDLVIKVLNKRLCSIGNADEVLTLPDIVLESLVLLLGDGECSSNSGDEDEEDDDEPKLATVSPQITKAVEALVLILKSPKIQAAPQDKATTITSPGTEAIRRNAFEALGKYSLSALGVDEESIRALVAQSQDVDTEISNSLKTAGAKYSQLKDLVFDGVFKVQMEDAATNPALTLATRLVEYEEEILGTTLWHTRGKRQTKSTVGRKDEASKPALAALPSESTVQDLYRQDPSSSTATASLLCFTGEDTSKLLSLACEITNESTDPLFRVLSIQAWLHVSAQLASSVLDGTEGSAMERLERVVQEIRNWSNVLEHPDCKYLALACLTVHIPDTWTVSGKTINLASVVIDVLDEITDAACKGRSLESYDVAMMCLGLTGIRYLQSNLTEKVDFIIGTLTSSAKTRRSSFGVYYGLAIIAQALPDALRSALRGDSNDDQRVAMTQRMGNIFAFLVEEFSSVVDSDGKPFMTFSACLRTGKTSHGLLSFPERNSLSLRSSQDVKARSMFMAFGVAVPALATLDTNLLLGMLRMLQSVRRCQGRGLALASTFQICKLANVLSPEDLELLRQEHSQVLAAGLGRDHEQLTEVLHEIAITKLKEFPLKMVETLTRESSFKGSLDVAWLLISAVSSLGSIPTLGSNAQNLLRPSRLTPDAKREGVGHLNALLVQVAQGESGGRLPDVAVILLGMMASWRNQPKIASVKNAAAASFEETAPSKLRFDQLPTAIPKSLLDSVLIQIQTCYERAFEVADLQSQGYALEQISLSLRCLERLSLPDQFATLFLDPLIHSKTEVRQLKVACTSLLLSQVSGRRRAAFDGREFYNLTLRLSSKSLPLFRAIMISDEAAELLLRASAEIVPKVPTDASETVLTNILTICLEQMKENTLWILIWLSSLQVLLKSATGEKAKLRMSPRTINYLRRYTMKDVFNGLVTRTLDPHCENVLQRYIGCLEQIPLLTLEEANFFSIKNHEDPAKQRFVVHCIAMLIRRGFVVEQAPQELSKVVAWYIQQSRTSPTILQILACSIADASMLVKADVKRDLLLLILEGLLETTASRAVGLQLLGILLARWQCPSSESDLSMTFLLLCSDQLDAIRSLPSTTLNAIIEMLVHNFPFHLASYCRQERSLTVVISNRLWRIYLSLTQAETRSGAGRSDDSVVLDCVRRALVCCSDANAGEDQFLTAVSSLLSDK